jgi:hypothetical protein
MKPFSQLNIKPRNVCTFVGDKIHIDKVIGKEIIAHHYEIKQSKFPTETNDKCLYIQIELKGEKRVIFTTSKYLMDLCEQAKDHFPFTTTIVKEEMTLLFK